MAAQPPTNLFNLFGQVIWGDFADLTMYRRPDGRLVVFAKTWPKKPASPAQQIQRDKLAAAAADWKAGPTNPKQNWDTAAKRASLCMHGYDLFMHWKLTGDRDAILTLERQTNTKLIS